MSKARLTGKRAVWTGLLGTPVLLIAAVTLIGVTTGSAGPSKGAKASAGAATVPAGLVSHSTGQTTAEVMAYWTPEKLAAADAYPATVSAQSSTPEGAVATVQSTGPRGTVIMKADGSADRESYAPQSAGAVSEPFHAPIPYTQWQWFGRYNRNVPAGSPNLAIATIHKMFFTQDHDGNGTLSDFVCSSSSVGPDGVWTAGHGVNSGLSGADGAFDGWSINVLMCPSWDNGAPLPIAGCWAATNEFAWSQWIDGGTFGNWNFDHDFGVVEPADVGTIPGNGLIGNFTGWLGLAWGWGNVNRLSFGYPAGPPFTGNKIEVCASSFGYVDGFGPSTPDSQAIGCDMTGGSSGGPWILGFGRNGGQPGGAALNWINGHNDWGHNAVPEEMNSPYYDCPRVLPLYNVVNDTAFTC